MPKHAATEWPFWIEVAEPDHPAPILKVIPANPRVAPGDEAVINVGAVCPTGGKLCDLTRKTIRLVDQEGNQTGDYPFLAWSDTDQCYLTDDISVPVPSTIGKYLWKVKFDRQ
jgi:hypothetical protein